MGSGKPTAVNGGVWSQSSATLPGCWSVCTEDRHGTSLRVLLEGQTASMATSTLDMENCGTTAVYFSWEVSL